MPRLDQELEQYRSKPLADTVEFLFLDGISQMLNKNWRGKTPKPISTI